MNRFTTYLFVFALLVFSSCGDDEDDLPLIGTTWTEVSSALQGCDDESENEIEACATDCDVIIFNADGTITIPGDSSGGTLTYEVSGNRITVDISAEFGDFQSFLTYVIVEDVLTLTEDDAFDGCTSVITMRGS